IRRDLDGTVRRQLFGVVARNIAESEPFRSALGTRLSLEVEALEAERAGDSGLDGQDWLRAYVLAVSKWLLSYMMQSDYRVTVRLLPSYSYSVEFGARDMASLAFSLEPMAVVREDPSGLTTTQDASEVAETESKLACDLLEVIASMEDLDDKLAGD